MEKLMAFMEKYLVPVAAKIGSQRHLVAVRDGFVAMIPITMAGAFATLINNLPVQAYKNMMASIFGEGWTTLGGNIWWASIATMALFLAVSVAYFLAKSYNENELQAGLISLSSFLLLAPQVAKVVDEAGAVVAEGWGFIPKGYISTDALFTAIIVAIIATELYVKLSKVSWLTIKMPDSVPPAVSRSFAKLLPGVITLFIMGIIGIFINKFSGGLYLNDLLSKYLSMPLVGVADSFIGAIVVVLFIHVLWIFGLHGSNIALPVVEPILLQLGGHNEALAAAGATEGYNVFAGAFLDAFVYLGGSGMILGLIIALLIAGRRRKEMIALGGPPSLFNISEPMIFGLPIVLNPMYAIPFVLAPIICAALSYFAISSGLVHPVIMSKIPWVTPPIMGGLMATGHWTGGALAAVNLLISIGIYLPFVAADERMAKKKLDKQNAN
ncbi:PTS sugar transporter subunit IIC [[Clostridium] dakarense]|uniref:PTS sugar transporter subunit IIC n=1 Tax=Faecalimicrobium dakarense TaxID=1301100 RepID=UPI0004B532BB|nr:PTS transporter subunit EIIC [[Clostridium] dakarense]